MSGIQRYEPRPQEWPQEDSNGDLVTYEDHVKVVEELAEALRGVLGLLDAGSLYEPQAYRARAALAKIKEQQA